MRYICDRCKENTAKNFLCEIIGGERKMLNLCDDCFRAYSASDAHIPLDGRQMCYYCGSPAQAASRNDEWEQSVRGQRFHYTCYRCARLYYEFLMTALPDIPNEPISEKQNEMHTRLLKEIDRRVLERVRK